MWLFDFNLLLYPCAELRQNGIHLIVEVGCVLILMHLTVVALCLRGWGLSLRLVGNSGAVR